MSEKASIILKSREDILCLLKTNKITLLPSNAPIIKLELEKLTDNENTKWSDILNSSYHSCGCGEGTIFLIVAVVFCIFYGIVVLKFKIAIIHALFGFAILFATSFIGKLFGMILGIIRFRMSIMRLLKTIALLKSS